MSVQPASLAGLSPGTVIELRSFEGDEDAARAVVAELDHRRAVLTDLERTPGFGEAVSLRWHDEDARAWQVSARVSDPDPNGDRLELTLLGDWSEVVTRRRQRVSAARRSLLGETVSGSLPAKRRVDMVCLDVSSGGVGVSGVGRMPAVGDVMRLRVGGEDEAPWLEARVARVESQSFGRWLAGLELRPRNGAERELLLAWRDAHGDERAA
jgi:hypothetical protein